MWSVQTEMLGALERPACGPAGLRGCWVSALGVSVLMGLSASQQGSNCMPGMEHSVTDFVRACTGSGLLRLGLFAA